MRLAWFKDPDNIVYADAAEFTSNFEKETGIDNLQEFSLTLTKLKDN